MGLFNNRGDSPITGLTEGLMANEGGDQFSLLKSTYEQVDDTGNDPSAAVENVGPVPGAYSLFNPFSIFRYSKFGLNDTSYDKSKHLDEQGNIAPGPMTGILNGVKDFVGKASGLGGAIDAVGAISNEFKSFNDSKKEIENPTASNIIRWAMKMGREGSEGAQSPVPYTTSDFIWCKYYGKVPNNRMVTLRRYPLPIEDNILINTEKAPLIPTAQAVTWYGEDIGNNLNKIINLNWGLNWKNLPADVKDLTGNEISVDLVLEKAGIPADGKLAAILKSQVFTGGDTIDVLKLAGYDASIQEYIRGAYLDNGPYWNRVIGPVNVIHETQVRDRGFKQQADVELVFEYSLRSYGGINPKIAFLDLLGNFLSLTYNTAPFWGGSIRYFEKTGVTLPGLAMEVPMLNGDVSGTIKQGLETLQSAAFANVDSLVEVIEGIGDGVDLTDIKAAGKELNARIKASPIEKLFVPRLGALLRKPLSYRSILDGRAVGEWHVTVGNPMNPIAMIGNLCLDTVKMEVGETLGLDDFPTEYKFIVKLKHGRPRAKQDIESMFNLGNGAMTFSQLARPSSGNNSYGESNSITANSVYNDGEDGKAKGTSQVKVQEYTTAGDASLESLVAEYGRQVRNMYGSGYFNSKVLPDYFKELKTKD